MFKTFSFHCFQRIHLFLQDQILDLQQEKLAYHSTQQVGRNQNNNAFLSCYPRRLHIVIHFLFILDEMSKRMLLSRRFPINRWKDAQEFLHSPNR